MIRRPPSQPLLGAALLGLASLAPGCQTVGPTTIRNGRAVYNDAVVATNSQQVLSLIVHLRYDEPHGLMAVSAVTANVRVQSNVGVNIGIGPSNDYVGNLVPLSAGALYEENPTISYTPLDGEQYVRKLLTPLPLDIALLILRATNGMPGAFSLLVRSINGIENPAFIDEPGVAVDKRIDRVDELLGTLARRDHLEWMDDDSEPPIISMVLSGEGREYEEHVTELLALLGLEVPADLGQVIEVPTEFGLHARGDHVLRVRTRSLFDLFRIAAASVEVAEEDLAAGLAGPLPPRGSAGVGFRIHNSNSYPEQAMIAIENHGTWYYVDGTDSQSKRTFALLESLMSMLLADSVSGRRDRPVLTMPVSR